MVFVTFQTTLKFEPLWLYVVFPPFLHDVLDEKSLLCRGASRIGGHPSCFWDPILMFCAKAFLFISCVSTPPELLTPICILRFNLHVNFQEAFRPKYEILKALLVHRQVLLPISSGGIGFIYTKTIASTTYLGGWMLVALIIISRFTLDSHPFLLVAIKASSLNSLPFQVHWKLFQELLPSFVATYLHLFEQFARRGIN
jgi:hypothetical protein